MASRLLSFKQREFAYGDGIDYGADNREILTLAQALAEHLVPISVPAGPPVAPFRELG